MQKIIFKLNIVLFLLTLSFPMEALSGTYKWVDSEGKLHFADEYSKVPRKYQDQVEKKKDSPVTPEKEKDSQPPEVKALVVQETMEPIEKVDQEQQKDDKKKVSLVDKVKMDLDKKGNVSFSGKLKNNSNDILSSVKIAITIVGMEGKVLKKISSPVMGELPEILKGKETGKFNINTEIPLGSVKSYKYSVSWNSF